MCHKLHFLFKLQFISTFLRYATVIKTKHETWQTFFMIQKNKKNIANWWKATLLLLFLRNEFDVMTSFHHFDTRVVQLFSHVIVLLLFVLDSRKTKVLIGMLWPSWDNETYKKTNTQVISGFLYMVDWHVVVIDTVGEYLITCLCVLMIWTIDMQPGWPMCCIGEPSHCHIGACSKYLFSSSLFQCSSQGN